jgi:hypothetical protein
MRTALILPLLLPASACFAQAGYTYVLEAQTKLGNEPVPTYRTLADTAGKPSSKLFAHATIYTRGRVGTRWAIVRKGAADYLVRTSDLPADARQLVLTVPVLKPIPFDPTTSRILYTEVVPVAGASQAELYARAKLWFADTFKATKAVVQADDKEAGIIQGTAFQEIAVANGGVPMAVKLWYTIKIAFKDGRYKYDINDLRVQNYASPYTPYPGEPAPAEGYISTDQKKGAALSAANSARRELATVGTLLSASIVEGMSKPAAGTTDGKDW